MRSCSTAVAHTVPRLMQGCPVAIPAQERPAPLHCPTAAGPEELTLCHAQRRAVLGQEVVSLNALVHLGKGNGAQLRLKLFSQVGHDLPRPVGPPGVLPPYAAGQGDNDVLRIARHCSHSSGHSRQQQNKLRKCQQEALHLDRLQRMLSGVAEMLEKQIITCVAEELAVVSALSDWYCL